MEMPVNDQNQQKAQVQTKQAADARRSKQLDIANSPNASQSTDAIRAAGQKSIALSTPTMHKGGVVGRSSEYRKVYLSRKQGKK